MIFINLPVSDLAAATRFYEAIGCTKNPQFSDENSASMVWSETITIQLLTRSYFSTFTPKHIANAHNTSEVLLALARESREDVDAAAQAAAASGGRADIRQRQDMGCLYNRAVEDPDGHVLELIWMDMSAATDMAGEKHPNSA
jgi:predicted lactoylglutathione lyase